MSSTHLLNSFIFIQLLPYQPDQKREVIYSLILKYFIEMGSFFGHALPGTFFYMFGVWHLLNAFYYHIKSNGTQQNYTKKSAMAYSFRSCCQKKHIPLEGIVKLVCCIIGMAVESYGFFLKNAGMYQHFTMYSFFGFAGLIDILVFYEVAIPLKFDYGMHAFSFFIEGLLFAFHVHGRTHLDVTLHILLVYTCYSGPIIIVFMILFEKYLIFNVFYGISLMVQGSWFWQVGSILYPIYGGHWCETCMNEVMKATVIFCWHLFLNGVFVTIMYAVMVRIVKRCESKSSGRYEQLGSDPNIDIEEQRSELLSNDKEHMNDSFL